MKHSNRANILLFPLVMAATMPVAANSDKCTAPAQEQNTSVTVNGYSSWEEAYAAEAVRLAAMGLK